MFAVWVTGREVLGAEHFVVKHWKKLSALELLITVVAIALLLAGGCAQMNPDVHFRNMFLMSTGLTVLALTLLVECVALFVLHREQQHYQLRIAALQNTIRQRQEIVDATENVIDRAAKQMVRRELEGQGAPAQQGGQPQFVVGQTIRISPALFHVIRSNAVPPPQAPPG